jgi:small nuclear ribonucleoprotein (snRNP)-like protein
MKRIIIFIVFTLFFYFPKKVIPSTIKCETPRKYFKVHFQEEGLILFRNEKMVEKKVAIKLKQIKLPLTLSGKLKSADQTYSLYLKNFTEEGVKESYFQVTGKHNLKKINIMYPLICTTKNHLDHKIFF